MQWIVLKQIVFLVFYYINRCNSYRCKNNFCSLFFNCINRYNSYHCKNNFYSLFFNCKNRYNSYRCKTNYYCFLIVLIGILALCSLYWSIYQLPLLEQFLCLVLVNILITAARTISIPCVLIVLIDIIVTAARTISIPFF